jgi:hypothetical protein
LMRLWAAQFHKKNYYILNWTQSIDTSKYVQNKGFLFFYLTRFHLQAMSRLSTQPLHLSVFPQLPQSVLLFFIPSV